MYLPLGGDMAVREAALIGIFDLDHTTASQKTRQFLYEAEKNGETVATSQELPKSFVLTAEYGMQKIYLSQFNSMTLEKRMKSRSNRNDHERI